MRNRLLQFLRDIHSGDLNPVMVKELRQSVRSRFVNSIIVFFLLALLLVTGVFLFTASVNRLSSSVADMNAGAILFGIIMGVLGIACLLVPGYASQRFSRERFDANPDLMFTTTLTPGRIIRGKFLANYSIVILLLSLCLPFMALSYLLRGIDLVAMGGAVLILLASSAVFLMLGLLVGSFKTARNTRQMSGVGMVFLVIWLGPMLISGLFGLRHSRGLGFIGGWLTALATIAGGAVCMGCLLVILYSFAVFILSPSRSNRHLSLRLGIGLSWLCYSVLCCIWTVARGTDSLVVWYIPTLLLFSFMLLIALSEGEQISNRIRRSIPRRLCLRVLAFPFFNGPVRGLVWCLGHLAATFAIAALILRFTASSSDWGTWERCVIIMLYAVCYCLTAGSINRMLPGQVSAGAPWLIVLYFTALALLLPGLFEELYGRGVITWCPTVEYGNLFAMLKDEQAAYRSQHLAAAVGWFVVLLLLNTPWFFRNARDFTPLADDESQAEGD